MRYIIRASKWAITFLCILLLAACSRTNTSNSSDNQNSQTTPLKEEQDAITPSGNKLPEQQAAKKVQRFMYDRQLKALEKAREAKQQAEQHRQQIEKQIKEVEENQ